MIKKLLSILLVMVMVFSVTACGKKKDDAKDTASVSYLEQLATDQKTYEKYVTLGQYTGIEVTVDRTTLQVTDANIKEFIDGILTENAEETTATTGTTKSGDSIVLDYSGYLNGTAFSGGTATDAKYTVGSGQFITDLDTGLAGLEVGKQYDVPCKFPADYSSAELAGKDVIFKVTVNGIVQSTPALYTDELVKTIASTYSSTATTTQEFNVFAKEYLTKKAQETFDSTKYGSIWEVIAANCKVSGYPEAELNTLKDTIVNNVKSEFASNGSSYGITDYLTYLSSVYGFATEAEFLEYATEYAQNYLDEKMIITMIAKKENISVSNEEITKMGEELATYYGYASFDEIISTYGSEINLEVGYSVLSDSVIKLLLEKSIEK